MTAYHQSHHTGVNLPFAPPALPETMQSLDVPPEILVFGSAAIDITSRISSGDATSAMSTTVPGQLHLSPGGVGRNIAECASRLSREGKVMLVSAVGAHEADGGQVLMDSFGLILDREMKASGMRTDGLLKRATAAGGARTAVCNLILDDKAGLVIGVADMDIVESITTRDVSGPPRRSRVDVLRIIRCAVDPRCVEPSSAQDSRVRCKSDARRHV